MANIDKILLEWSYRCKKGYPDFNNSEDMAVLKQVMAEMTVSFPTTVEELVEINVTVNDGLESLQEDEFHDLNKILYEGSIETFNIPAELKQKLIAANKMPQFTTFIKQLPGGESEPAIQNFIDRLSPNEYDELVNGESYKNSMEYYSH